MAKDDFESIVFRVLVYLYACEKRKVCFNELAFKKTAMDGVESEAWFMSVLRRMTDDGLIAGLVFVRAWGQTYILACDLCDVELTTTGIRYLKENSGMRRLYEELKDKTGLVSELLAILGAFMRG